MSDTVDVGGLDPGVDPGVDPVPTSGPGPAVPSATRGADVRLVVASRVLATLAVCAVWCALYLVVLSSLQHWRTQETLSDRLRSELALQTLPIDGPITAGDPIGRLSIPSIGVDEVMVEGTAADQLESGPGHRRDTPLPGQSGVSVVMGRSIMFGSPFDRLGELGPGSEIAMVTGQGQLHFRVDGVRRSGDPGPLIVEGPVARLTLIGSDVVGSWFGARLDTVLVDATLLGRPLPDTATELATIDASEASMGVTPGARLWLTWWLTVAVGLVASIRWVRPHWRRSQITIVYVPVLVAVAWLIAESAALALPNLM